MSKRTTQLRKNRAVKPEPAPSDSVEDKEASPRATRAAPAGKVACKKDTYRPDEKADQDLGPTVPGVVKAISVDASRAVADLSPLSDLQEKLRVAEAMRDDLESKMKHIEARAVSERALFNQQIEVLHSQLVRDEERYNRVIEERDVLQTKFDQAGKERARWDEIVKRQELIIAGLKAHVNLLAQELSYQRGQHNVSTGSGSVFGIVEAPTMKEDGKESCEILPRESSRSIYPVDAGTPELSSDAERPTAAEFDPSTGVGALGSDISQPSDKQILSGNKKSDILSDQLPGPGGIVAAEIKKKIKQISAQLSPDTVRRVLLEAGLFDYDWYLSNNPDVREHGMDPLRHYLLYGCGEGRAPIPRGRSRAAKGELG